MNLAGIKRLRTAPLDPPAASWTCTKTGLIVPKTLSENLHWRKELRQRAEDDSPFRAAILSACSQSFLYWCNAFIWTFRQKTVGPDGTELPLTGSAAHVPFITWPVQDEAAIALLAAIEGGKDINLEKSRDMGATWLLLAIADWFFLFRKSVNIGAVSRKEVLVDKPGDMDSLFEKIRYIHRMLPIWQVPPMKDTYMFLHNLEQDSTITGESTNADVGRGGRKMFYIVDEAAFIRNAGEVESSLSQNTVCQAWASNPNGPSTQFHKRILEKRGVLVQLPWYRHPEKAAGAEQITDEAGRIRWTSPWYRKQQEKYSKKTIAREIDMDHGQAGDMFFDYSELARHRSDHQTDPLDRGDLVWCEPMTAEAQMQKIQEMDDSAMIFIRNHRRAPWRFWFALEKGRPPQYWSYVFGIDVSNGAGGSNSVISVLSVEMGQIVAKFWDAYTSPEELAVLAAQAGVWFGGLRPPAFLCWENNGPGGIFGRKLVGLSYPSYYRQRIDNTIKNSRTPRWGWHSNSNRKEVLLGMYRDALNRDDLINPCMESLDEAADYIYDSTGSLIPARLKEEPFGGRQLHGDHVIADALCWLARGEMPRQKNAPIRPPHGSYADRREKHKRALAARDPWK